MNRRKPDDLPVIARREAGLFTVTLNRSNRLNSLDLDMVRRLREAMEEAADNSAVRMVLLRGAGDRGFCAGGDIKSMARGVMEDRLDDVLQFLREEYALDLRIHQFPKPVVVLAHGITMGGGLGLAAGADVVMATETTRMAMPETRIGLFPDVGATGWMFAKCPRGYPEFLGLTGYEMKGAECVRLGFASCLIPSTEMDAAIAALHDCSTDLPTDRTQAARQIRDILRPFEQTDLPEDREMDEWVRDYFAGKTAVPELLQDLRQCSIHGALCKGVFARLSERSPTGVVLTMELLRRNRGRSMAQVFDTDLKAARYMLTHPDFVEGVRARLFDKDNAPQWQPDRFEDVGDLELDLALS